MKTYLLTSDVLQSTLRYLFTRPYAEVHNLIEVLAKLEENKDGIRPEPDKKKV